MTRRLTIPVVFAACLAGPAAALGQPLRPATPSPVRLERIDQMVEDIGPLSASLRAVEFRHEPQAPAGFEDVYADPDRQRFYRFNGALAASIPRSLYESTEDGPVAMVPAGTIYYIGDAPAIRDAEAAGGDVDAQRVENVAERTRRLSSRVSLRVSGPVSGPEALASFDEARDGRRRSGNAERDRAAPVLTVWSSDSYRRTRLHALLRQAAEADGTGRDAAGVSAGE